jgi:hypothetical protein
MQLYEYAVQPRDADPTIAAMSSHVLPVVAVVFARSLAVMSVSIPECLRLMLWAFRSGLGAAHGRLGLHIGVVVLLLLLVVQFQAHLLAGLRIEHGVEVFATVLRILPALLRRGIGRLRPGQVGGALLHLELGVGFSG